MFSHKFKGKSLMIYSEGERIPETGFVNYVDENYKIKEEVFVIKGEKFEKCKYIGYIYTEENYITAITIKNLLIMKNFDNLSKDRKEDLIEIINILIKKYEKIKGELKK